MIGGRPHHVRPLALVLLLLFPAFAGADRACAQVSPGPLAAPHAALDGPTQCFQCHASGGAKAGMDARCLTCHTEVAWMRTHHRGFHARQTDRACAGCHPDHGGRDFQMVSWDEGSPEKFDHRRAGYALEGKHATLACRSCHKPELQRSPAAALIRRKNHATSWLGLETACASCHADPHRGQLGAACEKCHVSTAWKPAPGFDHARTSYPLTGAHATVACEKCHATPAVSHDRDEHGAPLPQWRPLPHAECADCHQDPHQGRFKGACAKCHVTGSFHTVSKAGFDHDQTRYPLRGLHATVECARCHDPRTAFGEHPRFARCADCHADAHAGTATLLGKAVDCAACHGVSGWNHPTYGVAEHAGSRYPLVGKHAGVPCARCHVQRADAPEVRAKLGTARVVMRPTYAACTSCHFDPHRGRFEPTGARPQRDRCLACHSLDAFRPTTYDARRHVECDFPLRGAHLAIPCQACHDELKLAAAGSSLLADSAGARPLHFDDGRRACADCHANPHGDQFAHRRDHGACDGCHDEQAFAPASRFDHSRDASFKLEGAHAKTPCVSCHVPWRDAAGKWFATYRPTPTRCEACHATREAHDDAR